MSLKYDNERDRNAHGYDAGNIVDGTVTLDPEKGEYVLLDDDGVAFSTQSFLAGQVGKKVRLTCISFEAMETIEKMIEASKAPGN